MDKLHTRRNTVLYADDDLDDLELVTEAFREYSSHVKLELVVDGVAAVSYLRNLPSADPVPCLIILDINMPRLDGKEALRKIRSMDRFREVPVVLFTTSISDQDKEFARQFKAGFITKPLNAAQMEMITDQFLEQCDDEIKRNITRKIQ